MVVSTIASAFNPNKIGVETGGYRPIIRVPLAGPLNNIKVLRAIFNGCWRKVGITESFVTTYWVRKRTLAEVCRY